MRSDGVRRRKLETPTPGFDRPLSLRRLFDTNQPFHQSVACCRRRAQISRVGPFLVPFGLGGLPALQSPAQILSQRFWVRGLVYGLLTTEDLGKALDHLKLLGVGLWLISRSETKQSAHACVARGRELSCHI